jgi:hypothetical protein
MLLQRLSQVSQIYKGKPMLKFNEYLKEENEDVIETDDRHLEENLDALNTELDTLTAKPYQNAPLMLTQLRGVLERYGINLPQQATVNFMNLSAELVYTLGETGKYLYMVYDTNEDAYVDGYAQVVDGEELSMLASAEVLNTDRNMIGVRHSDWYRKRDDDAGNSSEY